MKKIVSIILLMFSLSSMAFQEKQTNINLGIGSFATRGILGVSMERFFTENHALSTAVFLDLVGSGATLGYKYFDSKINRFPTNTFLDKCWFLFDCDAYPYVGVAIQYAAGTSIKISDAFGERNYNTESKWFELASFGVREVFKNNVTIDFEFSYRSIVTGGKATQVSGVVNDDMRQIELGYRNFGLGFAVGYLF